MYLLFKITESLKIQHLCQVQLNPFVFSVQCRNKTKEVMVKWESGFFSSNIAVQSILIFMSFLLFRQRRMILKGSM